MSANKFCTSAPRRLELSQPRPCGSLLKTVSELHIESEAKRLHRDYGFLWLSPEIDTFADPFDAADSELKDDHENG